MAEVDLFNKGTRERKKENKAKENQMSKSRLLSSCFSFLMQLLIVCRGVALNSLATT